MKAPMLKFRQCAIYYVGRISDRKGRDTNMYRIVRKEALRPTVTLYEIEAPLIAKKAQPGQFIILRTDENGERIPITINAYDPEKGTVTIIVQTVGATTVKLSHMKEGQCLAHFV